MSVLECIIESNQGYITYNQVKDADIPYGDIIKKLNSGELEKEERGIYRRLDTYVDELYVLQYPYPNGVYSLESALWLHGLSLTIPFCPVMSFPYGTNTKRIKAAGIKPVVNRSNHTEGIVEVRTPGGQLVRVYDVERTLVECLRTVYKLDLQIITPAFKTYMTSQNINYSKLYKYARLKVEQKLQSYLEVLQ